MLPKDLLDVTRYKGKIFPKFAGEQDLVLAEKLIKLYRAGVGKKVKVINKAIKKIENAENFRKVRGFAKILENFVIKSVDSDIDPLSVRMFLFERGFVTTKDERSKIIRLAAKHFGTDTETIENAMYADNEDELLVTDFRGISARELIKLYNLSLLQTAIFNSLRLTFWTSSAYKEIFRAIKWLGLMYELSGTENIIVEVTGPASILKMTRKYGTYMAKLVPYIIKAQDWWLKAEILENGRIYVLEIDSSKKSMFPEKVEKIEYDSSIEEEFARKLRVLGFDVYREPKIIKAGKYAFIPDFMIRKGNAEVFVEIVGFWTKEYLERKLYKIKQTKVPLIVIAREELGLDKHVPDVILFSKKIPVKGVIKKINEYLPEKITFEGDVVELIKASNVPEDYVVVGKYAIKKKILSKIKNEIDSANPQTLDDVKPILKKYKVGESVLPYLGYKVKWVGLGRAILMKSSQGDNEI